MSSLDVGPTRAASRFTEREPAAIASVPLAPLAHVHARPRCRQILSVRRLTGYTTVLKLLQIMTDKRLVRRDERARTHVYEPRLTEAETQRQLVGDLVDRAFGGSASKLVLQALAARKATPQELAEIRRLIAARERDREGGAR